MVATAVFTKALKFSEVGQEFSKAGTMVFLQESCMCMVAYEKP